MTSSLLSKQQQTQITQNQLNMNLVNAAFKKDILEIEQNLNQGADPWFEDAWAFSHTIMSGFLEGAQLIQKWMLNSNSKIDSNRMFIKPIWIAFAIEKRHFEVVQWTINYCMIQEESQKILRTALEIAIHFNDYRFVDLLKPVSDLPKAFSYIFHHDLLRSLNDSKFDSYEASQIEKEKKKLSLIWKEMNSEEQNKTFNLVNLSSKPQHQSLFEEIILEQLPKSLKHRDSARL